MLDKLKGLDLKKTGIFAAGVLFGTAGIKVLASKDAKKVYANCTAAVLRAKECVMKTVSVVQELQFTEVKETMYTPVLLLKKVSLQSV